MADQMERDLHTMGVLIAWMEEEPGQRALQVIHDGKTLVFTSRAQLRRWTAEVYVDDPDGTIELDVRPLVREEQP